MRPGTRRSPSASPATLRTCAAGIRCTTPPKACSGSPPPDMKCPYCKAEDTAVIDSRESEDGDSTRRRRQCESCGKRFTTYERVELSMPMVVKSNGNRVPYDREKVRTGFMRALHKRPVPTEYVDQAINRIEQRVLALGERELASRVIGEMVMRELKKMDDVAYIRFASVYEDFQRVDDFNDAIREVKKPEKRARSAAK